MGLVAGVDCSTQATKVLVVDLDAGRIVAHGRSAHAVGGVGGARESDPEQWWDALEEALAQTGRADEIAAIAVAGQQHGLVLLDDAGRPLRPAPLWNDTTSAPAAAALLADLGGAEAWARRVGSVPTASFTVANWAHVRQVKPAYAAATRAIRLPHDFLTERLCGEAVTDRGDASGTGWWSPSENAYAAEVLALPRVDLDPALLPTVHSGDAAVGSVMPEAAARLGLPTGTVVATGTGDNMAAAVGLGLEPGTPVLSLGTSGTAFAVTDRPACDPSGTLAGFADAGSRYLPLACTLNATQAVDRFAGWLRRSREQVAPAGEVVVLPYLDGERTPAYPTAAGSIVGLRHATTPQQMLQAVYDGAIEALLSALELLDATTAGLDADAPLVLVGGGAQGAAWQATAARLSGRAIVIPAATEAVAVGAAALAAAALTGGDAQAIARSWLVPHATLDPVPRDDERLARIRDVRARLHALNVDQSRQRALTPES
jgi:xylulokinase